MMSEIVVLELHILGIGICNPERMESLPVYMYLVRSEKSILELDGTISVLRVVLELRL